MEKKELQKLVEEGLSNIQIGKLFGMHRTTVGKLLLKYNIIRKRKKYTNCAICGNKLNNNIHNRSKCPSCITRIRRYRLKKRAVEYKGGKCIKCGYDKHISALTFHHINPDEKKFTIAQCMHKSWSYLKKELDKCDLLCSNCHNIEHNKYDDEKFLIFAERYKLK